MKERESMQKSHGESNILISRQKNREEQLSIYETMYTHEALSQEEMSDVRREYEVHSENFERELDEKLRKLYEIRPKVYGLQSVIDGYVEQVKSDPEVAKVVDDLLEKRYEEKRKEYEAKKDRATGKRVIIEKIKSSPEAQQNLEEILKLGTRITELNEIVNAKNVDKTSQKYQEAQTELAGQVIAIKYQKKEFAKIVGGFNKDKEQMTEEVLDDLLTGEAKVGEDGKILVTDMLAERIEKEGQNIGNAERGIEFNENCIQEITGKAPQQAENQGQENLEQEEQEQPEESKKPGFFKRAKNFFRQLFAKEDPKKALPDPEQQEQVSKEGQQEAPEKKKEESSFIKYIRANQDDDVLKAVMEKRREEIEQAVKRAQEQKENDDHGGPEL